MPATPAPLNTWRRIDGEWGVAVTPGLHEPGDTVTVTNRAGEERRVVLGRFCAYWRDRNDNLRATYRIERRAPRTDANQYSIPVTPGYTLSSANTIAFTSTAFADNTFTSGTVGRHRTAAMDAPTSPLGTHVINFGTSDQRIYRVTQPRNRSYLAVYRLDMNRRTRTGRARWIYAGRANSLIGDSRLTAATLLTEDQARAIGARLGFCANCGRTLTADQSVDRGIGPVCWARIRQYQALRVAAMVVPEYEPVYHDQCGNTSPLGTYRCTGRQGHAGLHVAHYSDGERCGNGAGGEADTWSGVDGAAARRAAAREAQRAADQAALAEQMRIAAIEDAELDDDNADPCDGLPACAYGPDGRMTDEWLDATMAMDREELAAFIATMVAS